MSQEEISRREFIKDAGLMVGGAAISSAAMVAAGPAQIASAQAQAGVTLEVLDPRGAFEVSTLNAPRLPTLEGKTICYLSDDEWQAWRTFPLLTTLLKKQFPTIKIVDWKEFPRDGDHGYPDFDKNPGLLKSKGCDAVILGNAG